MSQWIASIAITLAAMMTAANGGARPTGYGFAVFAIGSVAWAFYGWATGQDSLLIQNAILLLINLTGVWRWLGLAAHYQDGAEAAVEAAAIPLIASSALSGMPVVDRDGKTIGSSLDMMLSCESGHAIYGMISVGGVGGIGEKLFAVPWRALSLSSERMQVDSTLSRLESAEGIKQNEWPATAPPDWDRPQS